MVRKLMSALFCVALIVVGFANSGKAIAANGSSQYAIAYMSSHLTANPDCSAHNACFPKGGCVMMLGGSRRYVQSRENGCKPGGTRCADVPCKIQEFGGSKDCTGDYEETEVMRRACLTASET
jgi:hypothetical protein